MVSPGMARAAVIGTGRSTGCLDLVLGTVQLGLPYGVANATGQPDQAVANAIVAAAWQHGVRYYDTAQSYGVSEQVLGQALAGRSEATESRIVTKLKLGLGVMGPESMVQTLQDSLRRLRQNALWGALLHDEADLDHWPVMREAFVEAKQRGLIQHAGVSVYTAARALQAINCEGIDIIQVPANVFDRRMERAGVFQLAANTGKQIFIRSLYLQGLALMSPEQVKRKLPLASAASDRLHAFCRQHGLPVQAFAIDHVRHQAPGAKIIIGAETEAQVLENCAHIMASPLPEALHAAWTNAWPNDLPGLVDPRTWPASKTVKT